MEKKLDLNDLNIEAIETDELSNEGHGLTEIGASSNQNNTCGQGSCKTQESMQ
jgi:hypothetical protein